MKYVILFFCVALALPVYGQPRKGAATNRLQPQPAGAHTDADSAFTGLPHETGWQAGRYISPLGMFSESWNDAQYRSCNTAAGAGYMNDSEKMVIYVLNLARRNPRLFAETVLSQYPAYREKDAMKETAYYTSLMTTMGSMDSVGMLRPDSLCYVSAHCHAVKSGLTGYTGHARTDADCRKLQHFSGECCDYGFDAALDIVIDLLVDEDVPSLGHRLICLDGAYRRLGVSIQPHKNYRYNTVMDFYTAE